MRKLLFFIAGICMLLACSKSDQFMGDDLNTSNLDAINQKGLVTVDDEICFEGTSNFYCFASKEGRLVVNPDEMFLFVEAKLTHVKGQNYLLTTNEIMPPPMGPFLYRTIVWNVKMSAGGVVMMSWPEKWWELYAGPEGENVVGQVLRHTGCIITGPGVNKGTLDYNGKFDGVNFYVATHFTGQQVQEPQMVVPYAGIIGPAKFVFSMTLSKAACPDDK
jgi:hypothetical protein